MTTIRRCERRQFVQLASTDQRTHSRGWSALDRLMQLHAKPTVASDVEVALLAMPTPKAMDIYLAGLASASASHRRSCTQALLAIRDEVAPKLREMAEQGKAPASAIPALPPSRVASSPVWSRARDPRRWNSLMPKVGLLVCPTMRSTSAT